MIGAVTGFTGEAKLLPRGFKVICSGGDPLRARWQSRLLLDRGVRGLLSFGIAGGLEPGLAPGSLVVASAVLIEGDAIACHRAWRAALESILPAARCGLMVAASAVVDNPEAKRRLYQQSHALAVDLESGVVAEECRWAGRPFAVLRAVADPAERGIPQPALVGLDSQGRVRVGAVMRGMLRHPACLSGMVRLAQDSRAALRALAEAGTRFGAESF